MLFRPAIDVDARLSQILELLAEDSLLNVYRGELEVRPPGAPTTRGCYPRRRLSVTHDRHSPIGIVDGRGDTRERPPDVIKKSSIDFVNAAGLRAQNSAFVSLSNFPSFDRNHSGK